MPMHAVRFACDHCSFEGTKNEVEVHDCQIQDSIDASGTGRCEDYPCCGHTDGDGCQTRPEHTSGYWIERLTDLQSRGYDDYEIDMMTSQD